MAVLEFTLNKVDLCALMERYGFVSAGFDEEIGIMHFDSKATDIDGLPYYYAMIGDRIRVRRSRKHKFWSVLVAGLRVSSIEDVDWIMSRIDF